MFERFSDGARRVVVLAQEEARVLGHDYVGSEHLLLALARGDSGVTSGVLVAHGLTPPEIRGAIRDVVGAGGPAPSGHIPFTPRAKRVLEGSLRHALDRGDATITAGHIGLALLDEGEGVAAQVIDRLVDDRDALGDALTASLAEEGASPDDDAPRGATLGNRVYGSAFLVGSSVGSPSPIVGPQCSLCGRAEERAARVVVARGTIVCDECIRQAGDLLDAADRDASTATRLRFRRLGTEPEDVSAARAEIERAFAAVFPGRPASDRRDVRGAVEDGEGVEEDLAAMAEGARHAPVVVNDITVERVGFVDADFAEVSLGFWLAGSPAPILMPASAVLVDGAWKVSRATVAHFSQQARAIRRPRGPWPG